MKKGGKQHYYVERNSPVKMSHDVGAGRLKNRDLVLKKIIEEAAWITSIANKWLSRLELLTHTPKHIEFMLLPVFTFNCLGDK